MKAFNSIEHELNITETMTLVLTETMKIKSMGATVDVNTVLVALSLDELVNLNESMSVIHLVRHGRLGMRERNVVASEIISVVNSLLLWAARAILDTVSVDGLHSRSISLDRESSGLRSESENNW